MAYVTNKPTNNAPTEQTNTVLGYLNIGVMGRDGEVKRLNGGKGLILRKEHPVESVIADFCEKNPDKINELVNRLVITYGKANDGSETFDLGIDL